MTNRFAAAACLTALMAGAAGPAVGQSVSEGQSCGGLLCDMGIFGHKTTQPPKAGATAVPPTAHPVEAPPRMAAEPSVIRAEPARRIARKQKKIEKVVAAPPPRATVASRPPLPVRATAVAREPAPATAIRVATPSDPIDLANPYGSAPTMPAAPVAARVLPPPPREPVVLANPYVSAPVSPSNFQSVDPFYHGDQ